MSTAIFLIVFVAFAARVVQSAASIRNAFIAVALAIVAIGGYVATRWWLVTLAIRGLLALAITSAIMLVLGYGVPALLLAAERRHRAARMAAFFLGVLTAALAADVWRNTGGLPMAFFGVGVACFLIFKARFFEDVLGAD